MERELGLDKPDPREEAFLNSVKGYPKDDVRKALKLSANLLAHQRGNFTMYLGGKPELLERALPIVIKRLGFEIPPVNLEIKERNSEMSDNTKLFVVLRQPENIERIIEVAKRNPDKKIPIVFSGFENGILYHRAHEVNDYLPAGTIDKVRQLRYSHDYYQEVIGEVATKKALCDLFSEEMYSRMHFITLVPDNGDEILYQTMIQSCLNGHFAKQIIFLEKNGD